MEPTRLKQAIDTNDLQLVTELMTADPTLHRAPLGYGKNGPLTWVAECRVPWEPPSPERLAMARWMIDNGSDVHQGDDGPLMRASLNGDRVPMMALLVHNGADVNAEWNGNFPILWAPCESIDPVALQWLLDHGANPNTPKQGRNVTGLDYLLGTYARSPEMTTCIDLLLAAGGTTKYNLPGVLATIQNDVNQLSKILDADAALIHHHFPELDCGSTGARRLLLQAGTLLHVAAEFGSPDAARLLITRGADVNARGASGQSPVFHSVTQYNDAGLDITKLLIANGADLSLKAKLPGAYDRPDDFPECTPLSYAISFPGDEFPGSNTQTIKLLTQVTTRHSKIVIYP